VRATVQQALQQRRATGGIVPLAVEGRGELTAAVDQLRDLEQLGLDLLEDSLGLRLVQQRRDPAQLEGIEDVLMLGPAAPDPGARRRTGQPATAARRPGSERPRTCWLLESMASATENSSWASASSAEPSAA